MSNTTLSRPLSRGDLAENLKNGLLGGSLAAAIGLVVFFLGSAVAGPIEVAQQPGGPVMPLPWFMVVGATVVPGLVGALLLTGVQRMADNGTRLFQIAALFVTLASLFPALTQAGSATASAILVTLHVVAAGSIVWALTLK